MRLCIESGSAAETTTPHKFQSVKTVLSTIDYAGLGRVGIFIGVRAGRFLEVQRIFARKVVLRLLRTTNFLKPRS